MVRLQIKHSFSKQHFRAARYFASRAQALEEDVDDTIDDENLRSIHRSYVTGAIISAVAGLEASINELYLEACDNNRNALQGLSDAAIAMLDEWWEEIKLKPILLKYQHTLLLVRAERFDKGASPYQEVASLVQLRNALTHYKPEWDTELDVHEDLRKRLESRFKLNPFDVKSNLWFPHRCLGGGCAAWAVDASERFLEGFCDKRVIPNRL
jgi:hypothetical protein